MERACLANSNQNLLFRFTFHTHTKNTHISDHPILSICVFARSSHRALSIHASLLVGAANIPRGGARILEPHTTRKSNDDNLMLLLRLRAICRSLGLATIIYVYTRESIHRHSTFTTWTNNQWNRQTLAAHSRSDRYSEPVDFDVLLFSAHKSEDSR